MKRYITLIILSISTISAPAQNFYREDSTLRDYVNYFIKNNLMQMGKNRPIDSNDLEYLSIMSVFINGGAYNKGNMHMNTDGLLRKEGERIVTDREEAVQNEILKMYLDKLKITSADDLIKLMKQTSWNKDKPASPPEKPLPAPPNGGVKL